jgi:MYXO-CTERM domain-containing protein
MNKMTAALSAVFVDPTETVPSADLMPAKGSPLIGKGDAKTAPAVDFDLAVRPPGVAPDVGAYQTGATMDQDGGVAPHWPLGEGFKGSSAIGGLPPPPPSAASTSAGAGGSASSGTGGEGGSGSSSGASHGCSCELQGDASEGTAGLLVALALVSARRTRRRERLTPRGRIE